MLGDTVNDKRSNQTSSASNQRRPPLIRSSTESWVFWHGIFVLVHLFILLRTLKLLSQSWRQLDLIVLLGYIVTSAAEVVIIWNSVSFSVAVRKGNQYMDQILRDRSLLLVAVLMPLINALYCFTLPFFDVTNRNWFVFYVVTLILLRTNREDDNWLSENGGILRFSQVSYSLAHWMLCSPVFAFLDCYKSIKLMSDVTTADGVEAVPADGSQLTTLSLTMIATQGLLFLMKTFLVLCIYMTLAVRSPSPVSPPEVLHEEEGDTRMTRPTVAPSCTVMTATSSSGHEVSSDDNNMIRKEQEVNGFSSSSNQQRMTEPGSKTAFNNCKGGIVQAGCQFWPLQSFGLLWFVDTGKPSWFHSLVRIIEYIPQRAAARFGPNRFWMLGVPIVGLYFAWALCEGVLTDIVPSFRTHVTSEDIFLVTAIFVFLGREITLIDLESVVQSILLTPQELISSSSSSVGSFEHPPRSIQGMVDHIRHMIRQELVVKQADDPPHQLVAVAAGQDESPEDNHRVPAANSTASACKLVRADNGQQVLRDHALFADNLLCGRGSTEDGIQVMHLIGEGAFAKVFKGLWQGAPVAIKKIMVIPPSPSDDEGLKAVKHERMAIMEAAISTSLSHPNIVQTYLYSISAISGMETVPPQKASPAILSGHRKLLPLKGLIATCSGLHIIKKGCAGSCGGCDNNDSWDEPAAPNNCCAFVKATGNSKGTEETTLLAVGRDSLEKITSASGALQVQLVLEFCDGGSLKDALMAKRLMSPIDKDHDGCTTPFPADCLVVNYPVVLETAMDIARGLLYLHEKGIIHSDVKAQNILLQSSMLGSRGFIAKVSDFGLSNKLDHIVHQTHISSMFQGTKTHMAPEIFRGGHISKAADVYAFGITLWELYTSKKPFTGINPVFLPYQICQQDLRPSWPLFTPRRYVHLAQSCWQECPSSRPDFGIILEALQDMRAQFEATDVSVGEGRKHNTADSATLDPPNTTKPAHVAAAAGILAFKGLHQLQCPAAAACSGQQTTGCSSSSSSKEVIVFI